MALFNVPLSCVFFAEFHTVLGPKISYQAPEGFIRADEFESISEYVIPKSQLCGRLVTLRTEEHTIMGVPVMLENKKYDRNAMLFNLGLAFHPDADAKCYEPVARKLADTLRKLETEHEFLHNPGTKVLLENVLQQLLDDLNTFRESQVPIFEFSTSINVKLFQFFKDPIPVHDYDVPAPTTDIIHLKTKDWDLTMQQILPFVDGVNYVKRIALRADVDVHLVRKCIQHLLLYGCVRLIDIFQSTNVYAVTQRIHNLYVDADLQAECLQHLHPHGSTLPPPNIVDVFAAYCGFQHGTQVCTLARSFRLRSLAVNMRDLVVFGVLTGILRRVHVYPVRLPMAGANSSLGIEEAQSPMSSSNPVVSTVASPSTTLSSPSLSALANTVLSPHIRKILNGITSMDELCVATALPPNELHDALNQDPSIRFISK